MTGATSREILAGTVIGLLASITFGVHPTAARAVYAAGGSASLVIVATTAARALSLYVFCLLTKKPIFQAKADWPIAARGGFFQAVSVLAIFFAFTTLPGPVAITITFTHTLMLLFFMAWRGETKLDRATVAVTVAALGGLSMVLNIWQPQGAISAAGVMLALTAAVGTMSRLYVFGHQTKVRPPAVVGAETFLCAALFVLPVFLWQPLALPVRPSGYGWLALSCAAMSAGTILMFFGIGYLGAFRYSLLAKLEPVFTSLFAALLIGEVLGAMQYAGIAVVVGSLALYQYVEYRRRHPA